VDGVGSYIRLLALFAACMMGTIAGFNYLVNPYGNFDVPRIPWLNGLQLGFNRQPLLAKSLAVARIRPASVVLGNSRAERAYDPGHPGFTDAPTYNLAVGGADFGEVHRLFLESLATGKLRRVLLAVDFFDPSPKPSQNFPDVFMLTDESGRLLPWRRWQREAFILLSGTASVDSWWSLRHQYRPEVLHLATGVRAETAWEERQLRHQGGHRGASLQNESWYLDSNFSDISSPAVERGYRELLQEFDDVIALSAQHGIRLDVVINPVHARYNYLYWRIGIWPLYERWKRDLVAAAARSPRRVAVWDFSGISECTSEALPRLNDVATRMRWYHETGHFRLRLGNLVLDQVYGNKRSESCPGLGKLLDTETIDGTLAEQRAVLRRWMASHPADVLEIDNLARRHGRNPPA
jgi:hypothetical protein